MGVRSEDVRLAEVLAEREWRTRHRAIEGYYPDTGALRRELYAKHLRFFALGGVHEPGVGCPGDCDGALHHERALIAANRVGKTTAASFEVALHLTGRYPDWWPGRRFDGPVSVWAAGDTRQTTRDIQQLALMGPPSDYGSGMIPGECLGKPRNMAGVPDAVELVRVEHASGKKSTLGLKSYDQGRKSFQGTARHVVWLDEEPPPEVYEECLLRTMTTEGMMILTFTPMQGLTPLVLDFLHRDKQRDTT